MQHLQAAHSATLCVCGVSVKTADLRVHYKTSPCHPICPICGIGVKDARDLHELHASEVETLQRQSGAGAGAEASRSGGVEVEGKVVGEVSHICAFSVSVGMLICIMDN